LIYIEKEWAKRSAGSTFDSIKSDELSATLVVVPSSREEQTAIANVLSDMDTEISALESKLAKYRTLKTGMMQHLLTGKIRLI
jgi:type I restriction enzyme S subunit